MTVSSRRTVDSMRRFYDWFYRFYGLIERNVDPSIAAALEVLDPDRRRFRDDSILELCCGSGSLGLALAPRCGSYRGRDQSAGMLERARERWIGRGLNPDGVFSLQNVFAFSEPAASVDRIVLSFAIHLFPPKEELDLLRRFIVSARKGVIVIDHAVGWRPLLALVERAEGSWYPEYRQVDFIAPAAEAGLEVRDTQVGGARVLDYVRSPDEWASG